MAYATNNQEYSFNGVVINRKPEHFTKPKVFAMTKAINVEGKTVYRKVALSSVKEIDHVNYFPLQEGLLEGFPGVKEEDKPVKEEVADALATGDVDEGLARYEELKAQRAWLKAETKDEYSELKEKYGK